MCVQQMIQCTTPACNLTTYRVGSWAMIMPPPLPVPVA